jgi:hypothetical protein
MKYVLDFNVALNWVLPEQDADKAVQVRDEFRLGLQESAHVPDRIALVLAVTNESKSPRPLYRIATMLSP